MPADMTVAESHDIALELQHKVGAPTMGAPTSFLKSWKAGAFVLRFSTLRVITQSKCPFSLCSGTPPQSPQPCRHSATRLRLPLNVCEFASPVRPCGAERHQHRRMFPQQVEALDEVERCFVHVDFQIREEPEHKVPFTLLLVHTSSYALCVCSRSILLPQDRCWR